ncbi:MAG: carboxypeptidase regulatory-like domain-containing protein [Nitrospirae bacterium]|nr:carboxypeptidase regulatory-like domain-containing protein [Nitrospirota bacterium]
MKIFRPVSVLLILSLLASLTFGCAKTSGIEGKVVNGKSQPVAGVKVIARQNQPAKGYEQFETTTGPDGKFTFNKLLPSSAYTLSIWHKDWKTDTTMTVEAAEGETTPLIEPLKVLLTSDNDGIVTSTATGLQCYLGPDMDTNWNKANTWVKSLSISGGGWRMPTRAELRGLYDAGGRRNNWVWSGELNGPYAAWAFFFNNGSEGAYDRRASTLRAIAVRSR